jgi:hypothetical protein
MVAVVRSRKRSDAVTADDIANLIEDWADWKLCRPRDRERDETAGTRTEFGPKVPPGVWMTPRFKVYIYQDVTEGYESVVSDQREIIRLRYLCGMKLIEVCEDFNGMRITQAMARNLEQLAFWHIANHLNKKAP